MCVCKLVRGPDIKKRVYILENIKKKAVKRAI